MLSDSYIVYRNLHKTLLKFLCETYLSFLPESGIIKISKRSDGKVSFMKEWTKFQTFGMVAAAIALCILMLQIGAPV